MKQQYFVPVTDEMIYEHPEQIEGPLVPYTAGMECHEWLSIEINPDDDLQKADLSQAKSMNRDLSLVYSAA